MSTTSESARLALTLEAQQLVDEHYDLGEATVTAFGSGIINATFLVETATERGLLQKLHPMFPPEVNGDFMAVTDHLRVNGWEAPTLLPAKDGTTYAAIGGAVWRIMSFIDSDPSRPVTLSDSGYHDLGSMLARFHGTLASLDYTPAYTIPHFHETEYYAERLGTVVDNLPDEALQQLARTMLRSLQNLPAIPLPEPQLIHGDPQMSNSLFRGGKPLTFIDYDTIMRGSIWTDLGDMLRSLAEDVLEAGGNFPVDRLRVVSEGYRQVVAPAVDSDEFFGWALTAIQKLSLELGMRFLTDLVPNESYFGFDASKFKNSTESNKHRGTVQWKLYEFAQSQKEGIAR